jgi:hypothetical protein
LIWEFALSKKHCKDLINRKDCADGEDPFASYREECDQASTLLTKRSASSPNLNAVEERQYKK